MIGKQRSRLESEETNWKTNETIGTTQNDWKTNTRIGKHLKNDWIMTTLHGKHIILSDNEDIKLFGEKSLRYFFGIHT